MSKPSGASSQDPRISQVLSVVKKLTVPGYDGKLLSYDGSMKGLVVDLIETHDQAEEEGYGSSDLVDICYNVLLEIPPHCLNSATKGQKFDEMWENNLQARVELLISEIDKQKDIKEKQGSEVGLRPRAAASGAKAQSVVVTDKFVGGH